MAKKVQVQQLEFSVTLWCLALSTLSLGAIHWLFYDETAIWLRSLMVVGSLGLVVGGLLWLTDMRWHDLIGASADPTVIALSGLAGLAVWPVSWWVMSWLAEDVFFELWGDFSSPAIYAPVNWDDIWAPLVVTDVVLVPLLLGILLWGALRLQIVQMKMWQGSLVFGVVLGLLGTVLYGQGLAGLVGYGLCGAVAGFVCLQTQSVWAGFATHAVFMYANLDLLDNLRDQMAVRDADGHILRLEAYWGTKWLSLVMVAGLAVIILLQIIRFRTEPHSEVASRPRRLKIRQAEWLAIGFSLMVFVYVIVDEIQRRGGS